MRLLWAAMRHSIVAKMFYRYGGCSRLQCGTSIVAVVRSQYGAAAACSVAAVQITNFAIDMGAAHDCADCNDCRANFNLFRANILALRTEP